MNDRAMRRLLKATLGNGERFDLSSTATLEWLPRVDDQGAFHIGDGTYDMDTKIFLGSATEYVLFDVGNSRVDFEVPIRVSDGGTVTQITSPTTGVTLSTLSGQITTVAGTLAANTEETFTVTNTKVTALDTPIVTLASTASTGTPVAVCSAVAAGSFDITVTNLHATVALDALLVINFNIIQGNSS